MSTATVVSTHPIPDKEPNAVVHLPVVRSWPQLTVPVGPFHEWSFPDGTPWTSFYRYGEGYLLRFPNLADFKVSADGRTVWCEPVPGVTADTIAHIYHNQVLPLALSRQGVLVFHASAVASSRGAIAFMGASGRGKSTLAASLAQQGYGVLTDDGLQLEESAGRYLVQPSGPSIRLWQDSLMALVGEQAILAAPVQYTAKARVLAAENLAVCNEPQPLQRVYFLGQEAAEQPTFVPMSASEALIELVKHSFLLDIEARELIASHFDQLSRLVALSVFFRLDYPRRFEALDAVREAIIGHCSP